MAGRRFLALIALLGCVAAGCSEADSDPPPDEPSSQPADDTQTAERSEPTSSDVDVPTMPGRASKGTLKGAEAFVRHYIDLLNYAESTGRIEQLDNASRSCDGCEKYEDLFRRTYRNGGYMRSRGWTPTYVLAVRNQRHTVVFVDVNASRMRYRLSADSDTKIGRRDKFKLRFEVRRTRHSWVVSDFGVQQTTSNR